jgi:2-polyprenyl-3-methyl-5-hydroxy-6-metoxy-1,4-benzoquinol methylase
MLFPPDTLRGQFARRAWRGAKNVGLSLKRSVNQLCEDSSEREMTAVIARASRCKGAVIFPPEPTAKGKPSPQAVAWARYFAGKEYLSILATNAKAKKRHLFAENESNVLVFRGDHDLLRKMPDTVLWTNATTYKQAQGFPPNTLILYHWKEDERTASDHDAAALDNHARAIREASLVFCDSESSYRRAVEERLDAILISAENDPLKNNETPLAHDVAAEVWKVKRFQSYLNPGNRLFHRAMCRSFATVTDDNPCLALYFGYAMSSNDRGRSIAAKLAGYTAIRGKRYLDVGCAYAGFLVAMAEQGAEVAGFDVNEDLLALGRENLKDHGLRATITQCDLTKPDETRPFRERFDIITCNDVIEHVLDPPQAIRNLSDMLAPGGMVYFEIPNAYCPQSIVEDLHFRLFGITLLDHEEAKEYYSHLAPGVGYTVGHYLELPRFLELLDQAGLEGKLLEDDFAEIDLPAVLRQIGALHKNYVEHLERVPPPDRARVKERVERYLQETAQTPHRTPAEQREFIKRFGISVWKVLGSKR